MWRIFCDILLIFVQNYLIMKTINEKKNRLTSDTDVLSLINTVRKGVNYTLFFTVYEKSSINIHEWSNILHVSERTMQRYKKESINFEPLQSEKILQVAFIIEKGSVTINGISLTCFNVTYDCFTVAIIPYTFEHTNMNSLKKGDIVNVEWDVVGKYVQRMMKIK